MVVEHNTTENNYNKIVNSGSLLPSKLTNVSGYTIADGEHDHVFFALGYEWRSEPFSLVYDLQWLLDRFNVTMRLWSIDEDDVAFEQEVKTITDVTTILTKYGHVKRFYATELMVEGSVPIENALWHGRV